MNMPDSLVKLRKRNQPQAVEPVLAKSAPKIVGDIWSPCGKEQKQQNKQ